MKKISNLEELCAAAGAAHPTIESLSRRVYKGTSCGAWVDEIKPGVRDTGRRRKVVVRATGNASITGFCFLTISVNGRRLTPAALPPQVADYLMITRKGSAWWTDSDVRDIILNDLAKPTSEDFVACRRGTKIVVKFSLDLPTTKKHSGGVRVGSIVEGIDAEVEPEHLYYPFTEKQWDAVLETVDNAADDLWQMTHGCDKCPENYETGYHAIDPDCATCHGEGAIL